MFSTKLIALCTTLLLAITQVSLAAPAAAEPTADDVAACEQTKEHALDMIEFYGGKYALGSKWVSIKFKFIVKMLFFALHHTNERFYNVSITLPVGYCDRSEVASNLTKPFTSLISYTTILTTNPTRRL